MAPVAKDAGPVSFPLEATPEERATSAASAHAVLLELVVDAAGHVTQATVVEGTGSFAAASLDAANKWTFVPATRDGVAVAAKIRMRVDFAPASAPAAPPPPPANGQKGTTLPSPPSPPSATSATSAASVPADVLVRGSRAAPGATTLSAGEVRQVPGAFGDAFRAIDALPGVVPMASGLPYFFVRGAPPGNTGYYLDEIRVPLLFHLGFGPSVVHPAMVDAVDFYPGGYPAALGRFAGGIVSGRTTEPSPLARGEAEVRLYDAGALVETPFGDGRGDALVGGRYSYTGLALSIFAPDTRLGYWDYQTRVGWDLTPKDRISVFAFGSFDRLDQRDDSRHPFETVFDTEFHRVDVRYDRTIGGGDGHPPSGHLRVAGTVGYDQTSTDLATATDAMLALRAAYMQTLSRQLTLRAGGDITWDSYHAKSTEDASQVDDYDQSLGATDHIEARFPPRQAVISGVHADLVYRPIPRVEIVPGLRGDIFTSRPTEVSATSHSTSAAALDPRLATRVQLARALTLITTFGLSHQEPSFVLPIPALNPGTNLGNLQTAVQTSAGIEVRLPAEITATATGFLQNYRNMTDPTATCAPDLPMNTGTTLHPCDDDRVNGRAYGLELYIRRALTKRLTGWISYTLSRSTREAHSLFTPGDVTTVLSEYDRTHVLSLIGAMDLGKRWRVGARFYAYSGRPYSQTFEGVALPPYNDQRLPGFYRIDLRVEKSWPIGKRGHIAFVIEGLNITLRKEATDIDCSSADNVTMRQLDICKPDYVGPIAIPSIGVEGAL